MEGGRLLFKRHLARVAQTGCGGGPGGVRVDLGLGGG